MNNLKLLIKFPTRNRPEKFFSILDKYYLNLRDNNFEFIISCDVEDITMNNSIVRGKLDTYPHLKYYFKDNKSKVEAINNDITNDTAFDILLLASDDMEPVKPGYDLIIKSKMLEHFSDTDGVLWFNDGFQKNNLNTLVIVGKRYYNRFKYIYHPSYQSLYCDTEFTLVSKAIGKVKYFDDVIIKHIQYSIVKEEPDELYIRNNKLEQVDRITFQLRSQNNFA
jgi:hypothetical protein